MNHLTALQAAYIAGFLDGDGSIYVRLKPNATYKYGFQVAPYVVFYQSQKNIKFLESIKEMIGAGNIRLRKDGIAEFILGDMKSMQELIEQIGKYLLLKNKQASLLIQILIVKSKLKSREDFLVLSKLVDQYSELNYSKKRKLNRFQSITP